MDNKIHKNNKNEIKNSLVKEIKSNSTNKIKTTKDKIESKETNIATKSMAQKVISEGINNKQVYGEDASKNETTYDINVDNVITESLYRTVQRSDNYSKISRNNASSKINTRSNAKNQKLKRYAKVIAKGAIKTGVKGSLRVANNTVESLKSNEIGDTGLDGIYRIKKNVQKSIHGVKSTTKTVKFAKRLFLKKQNKSNKYYLKSRADNRILSNVKKQYIYNKANKKPRINTKTKSNSNKINSKLERNIKTKRKIVKDNKKSGRIDKAVDNTWNKLESQEIADTGADSIYRARNTLKKASETGKVIDKVAKLVIEKARNRRVNSYEKIKSKHERKNSSSRLKTRPRLRKQSQVKFNKFSATMVKSIKNVTKKVATKVASNPYVIVGGIIALLFFTILSSVSGVVGIFPTTTVMASDDVKNKYSDYLQELDKDQMNKINAMKKGYDAYQVDILSMDGTLTSNVNEYLALIAVIKSQDIKFSDEEKSLISEVYKKLHNIETEVKISTSSTTDADGKVTTTTTRILVITVEVLSMNYVLDDYLHSKEEIELYNMLAMSGSSVDGTYEDFDVTPVNPNMTQKEFIERVAKGAQQGWKQYKIYPSVTIAQAIIESGWGKSGLTRKANNLFGIKAIGSWTGPYVEMKTGEYGGKITIVAKFRKYPSWDDSMIDHAKFLFVNKRYTKAGVFSATSYQEQIRAIHRAGYATDPNYSSMIIQTIKRYNLNKYDVSSTALKMERSNIFVAA